MPKFKKKPVVIEAHQWHKNGDHPDDNCEVLPSPFPGGQDYTCEGKVVRYFRRPDIPGQSACEHCGESMHAHGWIDMLEGGHIVCPGDWIITGTAGERYPFKPDIFPTIYDTVQD